MSSSARRGRASWRRWISGKTFWTTSHTPDVQLQGEHGLWNAHGKVQNLIAAVREVAEHPGNVWTPVIALRREDAERLGYNNAANWQALVNANICDIAHAFKIHPDHLRWYVAFHEIEKSVHIHMVVFSTDPKEGFLTEQGIRQMSSGTIQNRQLEKLTLEMGEQLRHVKGKEVYGYLPADVKITVDQIVHELALAPRVANVYEL